MADIFTKSTRSAIMSRIRSRGNKGTEGRLVELFRLHEIRGWRRHTNLPGTPDFTFRSARVAAFIDGCFWHGCPVCRRRPASNRSFWDIKIARNRRRDRQVDRKLRKLGWQVIRIREHQLRRPAKVVMRIRAVIDRHAT